MCVQQLAVQHRIERLEVARDHGAEALVLESQDFLVAAHFHTSLATSTTRSSLRHCSSCVSLLPWCVLEKPHCGDRHRFSSGTYFAASSIFSFRNALDSNSPVFVDTRPRTTFFPLGRKRIGSKPPARAESNSMKKASTPLENMLSATGS